MKQPILSTLLAVGLLASVSAQVLTGDLTNGLVGYYSLSENGNDSIGGNNVNLQNGSFAPDGYAGGGFLLGTSMNNSLAAQSINNVPVVGNSDRTVSFWGKFPTFGTRDNYTSFGINWGCQSSPNGNTFTLVQNSTPDGWINFDIGWGYIDAYPQTTPSADQWRMITATYSGSVNSLKIYIDATEVTNLQHGGPNTIADTSSSPLNIYAQGGAGIANLGIWNTALTSQQVSSLYGIQSVPEPSTYALFGLGTVGILVAVRRRRLC